MSVVQSIETSTMKSVFPLVSVQRDVNLFFEVQNDVHINKILKEEFLITEIFRLRLEMKQGHEQLGEERCLFVCWLVA